MRKIVLGIAAAGSVFALTAAGAAGISLSPTSSKVRIPASGSVNINAAKCTGAPALDYTYSGSTITAVKVTGLTCSTLDANYKYVFTATIKDGATTPATLGTGSADVTSAIADTVSTSISLDSAVSLDAAFASIDLAVTIVSTV